TRVTVLRTAWMISGRDRPVTERHALATIGWRRAGMPSGFPPLTDLSCAACPQVILSAVPVGSRPASAQWTYGRRDPTARRRGHLHGSRPDPPDGRRAIAPRPAAAPCARLAWPQACPVDQRRSGARR